VTSVTDWRQAPRCPFVRRALCCLFQPSRTLRVLFPRQLLRRFVNQQQPRPSSQENRERRGDVWRDWIAQAKRMCRRLLAAGDQLPDDDSVARDRRASRPRCPLFAVHRIARELQGLSAAIPRIARSRLYPIGGEDATATREMGPIGASLLSQLNLLVDDVSALTRRGPAPSPPGSRRLVVRAPAAARPEGA